MERETDERDEIKIRPKHIVPVVIMILLTFVLEYAVLRSLSVYNTTIGTYLLLKDFLIHGVVLGLVSLVGLLIGGFIQRKYAWAGFYILLGIASAFSFKVQCDSGLGLDVNYFWILNKTGFDALNLQYLNGLTIVFTIVLVMLMFLSDFRLSYEKGKDGKRHFYVHSKIVSLIRWFITEDGQRIGDNPDYPIIANVEEEPYEEGWGKYKQKLTRKIAKEKHWNDKVRIFSISYGIWATIKLAIGFVVASIMSESLALRYLVIQNYLNQTGTTWLEMIQRYLGIAWMRFTGTVAIPTDFAITQAITFELFQFFEVFIVWFCIIWIVRLILGLIGQGLTSGFENRRSYFASNAISRVFVILSLLMIPSVIAIPTTVFEASTPFYTWQRILLLAIFLGAAAIFRFIIRFSSFENALEYIIDSVTKGGLWRQVSKVSAVILAIVLLLAPTIMVLTTVDPYMQGRRYEYVWKPAYLPTIDFTRWAYQLDDIQRINFSAITTNKTETLKEIRIFTLEAAKLNMKPQVGAVNWLSIDPSDVDIIYINGTEYWTTLLTLVKPPYQGDVDAWRAEHLLLTHSEKILAQDASTTNIRDVREIFGLNQTPLIYYGEGGLWKDVDEVYLHIPGFSETHLPNYQGPASYDEKADYTYSGFWRNWKFGWMNRFDFALGDYGDINALVVRDVNERISRILLPGVSKESDAYPVVDDKGNIYLLYWLWTTRESPSGFSDYPEHTLNQISRRFAVALVNLKNGEIDGYLMNKEREDYTLSFYRSFYSQWDKPLPNWLQQQLRYPEEFLERQIEGYNWYFQGDFQKWQSNQFYELTMDNSGNTVEDVRYIVMPLYLNETWSATRLVELYKGTTRNLAGMYVAPGAENTEKLYFVDFEGKTVIGPSVALSIIKSNAELQKIPAFSGNQWQSGNMLMYSLANRFYYVVPYYKEEVAMLFPQMVAVVDAQAQSMGYYLIQNPKDSYEVSMAATYAFQRIGLTTTEGTQIEGTLIEKQEYVEGGNTRWLLDIKKSDGSVVEALAKVEMMSKEKEDISRIVNLKVGDAITVRIDANGIVTDVLS